MSVCVCVCLSVRDHITRTTRVILTKFVMHVAYRRGLVLLRRGDEIPNEEVILGVFLPHYNAFYSIAYVTHTKTAKPIEMPFGLMTRVGPRYHVLDGGSDRPRGKGNFGGT